MDWIEAEGLESKDQTVQAQLEEVDGILVPGGFGKRGIEGMLKGIQYARENNVPYFGICLGMQTACIEFARNVCGLEQANSSEFDPATPHRVIYKLRELRGVEELGGTMRLGCMGTAAWKPDRWRNGRTGKPRSASAIGTATNSTANTKARLTAGGLRISGSTPDGTYVEIVEIPGHPFFLGCQFHPEFKSKPLEPHPLFRAFIKASYENRIARVQKRETELTEQFLRPEKVKQ